MSTNWLDEAEAAIYCRTKLRTLQRERRLGHIKAYAVMGTKRRRWRYRQEDCDAWLGKNGN